MGFQQPLSELLAAEAYARQKLGWDLGFIDSSPLGPEIPWDYEELARKALLASHSAVDLGTGGAEVLLRIVDGISFGRLIATEQWGPNARLAHQRLKKRNIPLVYCANATAPLPFASGAFDLVLDRHEALDPGEVHRVLAPGGRLVTQQCTPDCWPELHRYFDRATRFPDHYDEYADAFRSLGYDVELRRHDFETRFSSLSELVKMLVVAPWYVPGLSVKNDIQPLRALEAELGGPGGITLREGRYLLQAVKPR